MGLCLPDAPGHPGQGGGAFLVTMSADKTVCFEIIAFSRPGDSLVRLSGPMGRSLQGGGTKGYLRALRRFVEQRN